MDLLYFHQFRLNEERANSKNSSDSKDPNVTPEEIAKKHGLETSYIMDELTQAISFEIKTNGIEDQTEAKYRALMNLLKDPEFYKKNSESEEE